MEHTEFAAFLAMLSRAGIGHGTRLDRNPDGTAVQVECENDEDIVTDWQFDADGNLVSVIVCEGN